MRNRHTEDVRRSCASGGCLSIEVKQYKARVDSGRTVFEVWLCAPHWAQAVSDGWSLEKESDGKDNDGA